VNPLQNETTKAKGPLTFVRRPFAFLILVAGAKV